MKKYFIYMEIILLMLLYCFPLSAQEGVTEPVSYKKISENLYEIIGGKGAQGGAYIGDNGVLIIDAKMTKEAVDQTFAELRKITDKPVKYLINTHSDGDHVNGNQYFPNSVIIIAHENCRKEFFHPSRNGSASFWNNPELLPFIPSLTFTHKMNIYLGSKMIQLWYFGIGHTTGDIVVYFPQEKTAFLGDQIFLNRPQLIHSYKGGNSFHHVETLTRMLETLNAEYFCSGHSHMTDRAGIREHINIIQGYQDKVKNLIKAGMSRERIIKEFMDNEDRLINTIYNEIEDNSDEVQK